MGDLFGKGYNLFVDNWYTSEKLFRYLEENGTAACGTARANRLQLPESFKMEPLQRGQYRFLRDENMLAVMIKKKLISYPLYIQWRKLRVENGIRTEGQ